MTEDPPGLRVDAVRTWLADAGIPLVEPLTAQLFPGGRSNVTYRLVDAGGSSVVIRRPPLGNVMPTAHDMAREHRVLSGLNRVGFPAPEALALCTDESVTGAPFLVMAYVDGVIYSTAEDASVLSDAQADTVSAGLVTTLADLHGIDAEAAGLGDLGRPAGYLPRQLERWSGQWERTKTADLPAMDELRTSIAALLSPLPADLPWSLVHGDFRLDNAVLDRDTLAVRAVLDWEMSTLGDPISDLALALVYWSEAGDGLRSRIPVADHLTAGPGFWSRARIIEAYAETTGRSVDHLDACVALACYKLAVITESIHARTLMGKQLGAALSDADAMGAATRALADMGRAVCAHGTVAGLSA